MDIFRLIAAALIIEFWVIYIFKVLGLGKKSVKKWYNNFGLVAVLSDVTSVLIGVMIAYFLVPGADTFMLAAYSVLVQIIHDVLYYLLIVLQLPRGTNAVIDLMKDYAKEVSWGPIVADSVIMASTVGAYSLLKGSSTTQLSFISFVALYAITYVIY
jgi:uncharacterized protein YacL